MHDSGITTVLLRCGGGGSVAAGGRGTLEREAFRRWVAALLWGGSGGSGEAEGEGSSSSGSSGSSSSEGSSRPRVLRGKGVLALGQHSPRKFIFQSVEEFFDLDEAAEGSEGAAWGEGEDRESRVILIGWGLDREARQRGLEGCLR